jgi:hypothetical protein
MIGSNEKPSIVFVKRKGNSERRRLDVSIEELGSTKSGKHG